MPSNVGFDSISIPFILSFIYTGSFLQLFLLSSSQTFNLELYLPLIDLVAFLLSVKYKFIIVLYQLNMSSSLAFRLTRTQQTKCNFCLQWCETTHPQGKSLFCCQTCYHDFTLNGKTLQTASGQIFNLMLLSQEDIGKESLQMVRRQSESLVDNQVPEAFMRWSRIQSLFEEGDLTNVQIQTIEQQIDHLEDERDHLAQFISSISHNKARSSLTASQEDSSEGKIYLSQAQSIKENKLNDANANANASLQPRHTANQMEKLNKLQDYCKNLGATRIVKGYDYYFDTSEIKRYRDSTKPQKTRDFGCELSPNQLSNTKESARPSLMKAKSMRSIWSQLSGEKNLKLSQQELKGRILSYLQPRSQSVTLTRIMGSFVREAYIRTRLQPSSLELISFRVTGMDLHCYFSLFDLSSLHTVKLVNVGLTDAQLGAILELLGGNVARLVLTGNCLTEQSLPLFFTLPNLRQLYLGKNRISKYRVKQNIAELRTRVLLYL